MVWGVKVFQKIIQEDGADLCIYLIETLWEVGLLENLPIWELSDSEMSELSEASRFSKSPTSHRVSYIIVRRRGGLRQVYD